mgnify:CR=1 FL=1
MSKHIFWIASYPKSGNTLLRAIISSLFFSENGHFDFNMLNKIPVIEDVTNWLPKLKDNGTMFGDDYYLESVAEGCRKGLTDYYKDIL